MGIISFGCSLIFGTDLNDDNRGHSYPTASNFTWPALIAKTFDLDYNCRAHGGLGNLGILDRVLRATDWYPDNIFIIGWSFIDRFDYSNPNGAHFNNGSTDWSTLRPNESGTLAESYYKHLHSEFKDKFSSLLYINTAIHTLNKKGIPFVMTVIDDLLWEDKWHAPPYIQNMQGEIRPYISDFEGMNFLDWSHHRGFEISPTGHPLEEAHAAAAELMASKIDAILHKA